MGMKLKMIVDVERIPCRADPEEDESWLSVFFRTADALGVRLTALTGGATNDNRVWQGADRIIRLRQELGVDLRRHSLQRWSIRSRRTWDPHGYPDFGWSGWDSWVQRTCRKCWLERRPFTVLQHTSLALVCPLHGCALYDASYHWFHRNWREFGYLPEGERSWPTPTPETFAFALRFQQRASAALDRTRKLDPDFSRVRALYALAQVRIVVGLQPVAGISSQEAEAARSEERALVTAPDKKQQQRRRFTTGSLTGGLASAVFLREAQELLDLAPSDLHHYAQGTILGARRIGPDVPWHLLTYIRRVLPAGKVPSWPPPSPNRPTDAIHATWRSIARDLKGLWPLPVDVEHLPAIIPAVGDRIDADWTAQQVRCVLLLDLERSLTKQLTALGYRWGNPTRALTILRRPPSRITAEQTRAAVDLFAAGLRQAAARPGVAIPTFGALRRQQAPRSRVPAIVVDQLRTPPPTLPTFTAGEAAAVWLWWSVTTSPVQTAPFRDGRAIARLRPHLAAWDRQAPPEDKLRLLEWNAEQCDDAAIAEHLAEIASSTTAPARRRRRPAG